MRFQGSCFQPFEPASANPMFIQCHPMIFIFQWIGMVFKVFPTFPMLCPMDHMDPVEAASGAGGGPQRVARRGGGVPPRRLWRQRPLRHRDEFEAALGASDGTWQAVAWGDGRRLSHWWNLWHLRWMTGNFQDSALISMVWREVYDGYWRLLVNL